MAVNSRWRGCVAVKWSRYLHEKNVKTIATRLYDADTNMNISVENRIVARADPATTVRGRFQ